MRKFTIIVAICLLFLDLAWVDSDEDVDVVNIKALSELHGGVRSKPSRIYDRIASSGDGNAENDQNYDPTEQPTTLSGRAKNVIEEFLMARRMKTEPQAPETFYDEANIIHAEEEVTVAAQLDEETTTTELESETSQVPDEMDPITPAKSVDTKKAVLLVEGSRVVVDTTTVITRSQMPKQTSRFATLTCFECYNCKTYFLRKIRRCPRGLDMCVKEVAVGRRVAINGRNLIDLEINQYCSAGECPRGDGNITYACCHSNLCNFANRLVIDLASLQHFIILIIAIKWLVLS